MDLRKTAKGVTFDLDTVVKVKLTVAAKRILQEHRASFSHIYRQAGIFQRTNDPEDDGWYLFSFKEFMWVFGAHMIGTRELFEYSEMHIEEPTIVQPFADVGRGAKPGDVVIVSELPAERKI